MDPKNAKPTRAEWVNESTQDKDDFLEGKKYVKFKLAHTKIYENQYDLTFYTSHAK